MSKPLSLLALTAVLTSCGGPENYDQCILKKVSGDMNEVAVLAVIAACRSEFPESEESPPVAQEVPSSALNQLTSQGEVRSESISGNIYNGSDYTITEITVTLTDREGEVDVTRDYMEEVYLLPKTTAPFFIDIITIEPSDGIFWFEGISWYISSAKAITF